MHLLEARHCALVTCTIAALSACLQYRHSLRPPLLSSAACLSFVQNTRETCHAIRGMTLTRARAFLNNVIIKREAVAFCRFNGGVGRNPQIKTGSTQGRWPEKSARHVLDLLQNAESNAELQGLDTAQLYVHHIQCNQAPKLRRRTYRAHGRINPYMSSPSHIELVLNTKAEKVKKANEDGTVSRSRKGKSSQLQQGATGFEQ